MTIYKLTLYFLMILVNNNAVFAKVLEWKNLHAKFSLTHDRLYPIPLFIRDINHEEYVYVGWDKELNVDLYSYPFDPRVLLLFNSYGKLCGMRQTFIRSEIGKMAESLNLSFPYEYYANKPLYNRGHYWDQDLWHSTILFDSPDELQRGGLLRLDGVLGDNVYLNLDGDWRPVPRNECDALERNYTRQACYEGMGQHYFYELTPSTDCMQLQGVLLFYEREDLVGLAVAGFGLATSYNRSWYDDPPTSVISKIIISAPTCLTEFVAKYGFIALHLYFKEIPQLSPCQAPWQRNDTCVKIEETESVE